MQNYITNKNSYRLVSGKGSRPARTELSVPESLALSALCPAGAGRFRQLTIQWGRSGHPLSHRGFLCRTKFFFLIFPLRRGKPRRMFALTRRHFACYIKDRFDFKGGTTMDGGSNGRIWGMARRIPGTSYGRTGR